MVARCDGRPFAEVAAEHRDQLGAELRRVAPRRPASSPKYAFCGPTMSTLRTGCSTSPAEKRASAISIAAIRSASGSSDATCGFGEEAEALRHVRIVAQVTPERRVQRAALACAAARTVLRWMAHDVVHVGRIAAAHHDRHGHARGRGRRRRRTRRARRSPSTRQRQAAQPIAGVRIGAGQVEHERRADARPSTARQMRVEQRQVLVVAGAVGELHVEIARSLRNGKFFAPCIENVKTDGSSRKIAAVPLPWCTSQSTTATRWHRRSRCSTRAATATSLNTQ